MKSEDRSSLIFIAGVVATAFIVLAVLEALSGRAW